jgi:hypothetical protein
MLKMSFEFASTLRETFIFCVQDYALPTQSSHMEELLGKFALHTGTFLKKW